MGLNYIIDCRRCGSHSEYQTSIAVKNSVRTNLAEHIDTECAIRCPICRARLNNSAAEFREQVKISLRE